MMSPWKRQRWREKRTRIVRREEKKRWNLSKKRRQRGQSEVWVHRSRASAKALLILLALSVTASEDTVGLWCMAASSSAAATGDMSQGVRHYRDLVWCCWCSRGRAALRAPLITTPLRAGVNQREQERHSPACWPARTWLPTELDKSPALTTWQQAT